MTKVLVSDKLSKEGLAVLEEAEGIDVDYKPGLSEEDLAKTIADYEGLIIRSGSSVTARVIEAAGKLRVVGRAGIGVDNVDVKAASRRGIVVMNTPTGNAVTTAEHALALLFCLARKVPSASASMKDGKWEKSKFQGRELTGKTLGVIGLGNIGRLVVERALGLKMLVVGFDPIVTAERAAELGVELLSLEELFQRADAITVHTPLNEHTKGMVDDAAVAKMKAGVLLVNAARGGIYEDEALIRGLDSGKIGGVALDVFAEEPPGLTDVVKHPGVVATPHLGASTKEAQDRVAVEVAQQVVDYLSSGTIANSVNVPAVSQDVAPLIAPYLILAQRLGEFLAQVHELEPRRIEVECAGDAANLTLEPIVNNALAGVLTHFFEQPVNQVSARFAAEDRGIEVSQAKSNKTSEVASLVTITVKGKSGGQAVVAGTLASDRTPRLVRWGAHEVDAHLDGPILAMLNADRPGVIGTIGTLLGESGTNVSRMQMGLVKGQAASVWALDSPLAAEVLESIRSAEGVEAAFSVKTA